MSKYFLAIDNKRSKNVNKDDRFKIIPLSEITNSKVETISSIIAFTTKFNSEEELKSSLLQKGYITKDDLDKHFTICYKSPKNSQGLNIWKKCGKYDKDNSGVLFKNEAYLFNPMDFIRELYTLGLNQGTYFNLDKCTDEEKLHFRLIEMLCKEIINNKFYEYDYINFYANDILQYLNNAKNHGHVNKYYTTYVYELVSTLCYKFDKYDFKKENPLKNKSGKIIFNERHFFELVIYYANIKRNLYNSYNQKLIENAAKKEETIQNSKEDEITRIRKPLEGTQITFNDILKG